MNYISTKEASEKWGISARRVAFLAKEGKIKDAKLVGKSWLIPNNAEKPRDGRKQKEEKEESFRFPLLMYHKYEENDPSLTPEEQLLLQGQRLSLKGEARMSSKILKKLLYESENKNVKIGAAYSMVYNSIILNHFTNIDTYFSFFDDNYICGPHEKELRFIQYDIQSLIKGDEVFLQDVILDSISSYAPDAIPYISVLATYKLTLVSYLNNAPKDIGMYELAGFACENGGYDLAAASIYLYLCIFYLLQQKMENALFYAKRGIRLALDKGYYINVLYCRSISPVFFDRMLQEEPDEIREKLSKLGEKLRKGAKGLMKMKNRSMLASELTELEHRLIVAAIQGMPNKQVADLLKVSENTVSKKYVTIYEKTGTSNKQEMVNFFKNSFFKISEKTE